MQTKESFDKMPTITINVSDETAQAYKIATEERQDQLRSIISFFLKQKSFDEATNNLEKVMTGIGENARRRGMIPKILHDILNE